MKTQTIRTPNPWGNSHIRSSLSLFWISLTLTLLAPFGAQAAPEAIAATTQDQIRALHDDKTRRTPLERKLDSQLIYACRQNRGEATAAGASHLRPSLGRREVDRVLVDLKAEVGPELLREIERRGGRIVNSFPQHGCLRAWLPLNAVEPLAANAAVRRIRPAEEAMTHSGNVVSEGDITHQASFARDSYAAYGQGVKIGVLSDSVDHLAASQAKGELPLDLTVLPGQAGVGSGEGTAMLELIHDLAPESQLYFASAFSGPASFAENIRALYAAGCRIIVDDVIYFSESPFQDGVIAQAVNEVSAGGALFFSSAGNGGNLSDGTSSVWEGDFRDGGAATLGRGGRLHDFGGSVLNTLNTGGGTRRIDLFWADPLGKAANDYDVHVLDELGNVVASSTNIQNGNDDPYESINQVSPGQRVVIVKFSGANRFLWMGAGRMKLSLATQGTVRGHNASGATNAFSVAASWVKSPAVAFTGGSANPVELFSAGGPRRIFFSPDGTPLTAGNFTSTGGRVLQKPDITAADGASTSVPGFAPFFGTSAAAPHAAAIASMLWSFNPSLNPAQIRTLLMSTALDIEAPGFDADSGAGILMASAAIEAAPTPPPRLLLSSATVGGGNGNTSLDANECAQVFVTLRNRITASGPTATNVSATLRSLVPYVVADPTPLPFPNIVAGGFASNSLPFLVSIESSFVCNQTVQMELVILSSNGGTVTQQLLLPVTPPGVAAPLIFEAAQVPMAVPDLATVESGVSVSGVSLPLAEISVSVHLLHNYVSDLNLTLVSPDGTEVALSTRNGNDGDNYGLSCGVPTVFDDNSTHLLALGSAPFSGPIRPQESFALFKGREGSQVNGVWKLRVADVAEPDAGILQCWSLALSTIACQDGGGVCFEPPRVVSQPRSITVTNGGRAQFQVSVVGTAPLTFQWIKSGTNTIAGATSALLQIDSVSPGDAGLYTVEIVNRYGRALSEAVSLNILLPPSILTEPASLVVTNGDAASFSVIALGSSPLSYQWFQNGSTPLANETNATLQIPTTSPALAGTYRVQVTNPYGSVSSITASLAVVTPPALTEQPLGVSTNQGATVVFRASATGTAPLSYQWRFNESTTLAGATNTILTLSSVGAAQNGTYQLVVTSPYGQALSTPASLEVLIPNDPPSVTLNSPLAGQTYASSNLPVVFQAIATDPDGTVVSVEFFSDDLPLTKLLSPPYSLAWNEPTAGPRRLKAIATDNLGSQATSAVVQISVTLPTPGTVFLVSTGAVWRYLDTGIYPGTHWNQPVFDDSAWAQGRAELGYGDAVDNRPEATLLQFGSAPNNRVISYYFRRSFDVSDPTAYTNLQVRLMRDDGGAVYLNGIEVFRSNLPDGPLLSNTLASASVGGNAESNFFSTNVSPTRLLSGRNWVAVEIHQVTTNSSDISFDLELRGSRVMGPRFLTEPESLTLNAGQTAGFAALVAGPPPLNFQWFFNRTNPIAGALAEQLEIEGVQLSQAGTYSLVASNAFGTSTSSPALLTVIPPPTNHPPVIAWVSPTNGTVLTPTGLPLTLRVTASDPENKALTVDFQVDGQPLTTLLEPPFEFLWTDAAVGTHLLSATATDDKGISTTSAVVQVRIEAPEPTLIPLVSSGAVWSYEDTGKDLGTKWVEASYDDSSWKTGAAELGYGDPADTQPETTVISFGPSSTSKFPTAYFRKSFLLASPESISVLRFRLLRDDGAVVFLNGVEQFRDNMGDGTIRYTNLALTAINGAAETNFTAQFVTNAPLRRGTNVLAVEIHQSARDSSDLSFDLALEGLEVPSPTENQPPSVSISSPTEGDLVEFGKSLALTASASDKDGQVVAVDFFDGTARLASDTSSPYQFNWLGAALGEHLLTARATDNLGLVTTSSPVRMRVVVPTRIDINLVSTGSVWKYNDRGINLGNNWRKTDFVDSSWASGKAVLGFGNAVKGRPEATVLNPGSAQNPTPTFYFRQTFVVTNLSMIGSLELRLLRDDGAAVYINNTRVLRDNLSGGGNPGFTTLASEPVTGASETRYLTNRISLATLSGILTQGTNVIGVEVHQANPSGEDLAFDLGLAALLNSPPLILTQPSDLTITNGGNASMKVLAIGTGTLSYQWFFQTNTLLQGATTAELALTKAGTNRAGTYSVVVRNNFGTNRSREARLEVLYNEPPTVSLLSPTNGASFLEGAVIPLSAAAADREGPVAFVSFYDGTQELARLSNSPYVFDWTTASLGTHTLRAVAVDNQGATNTTSSAAIVVFPPLPPPSQSVSLISTGAVWRYLDDASNQETAWQKASFDDSAWKSGPAELGFGDAGEGRPEATQLLPGAMGSRTTTFYFRRSFTVDSLASLTQLTVRLLRDDGGIVYLNGVEIFRSNLPTGAVTFATPASSVVDKQFETIFYPTNVPLSLLKPGQNLVAVEVHQANRSSTDISFDLTLEAQQLAAPIILTQPEDQTVTEGSKARFEVTATGAAPLRFQWFLNGLSPISGGTNAVLEIASARAPNEGSYSVEISNSLGEALSRSALLKVVSVPKILVQPADQTAAIGEFAEFQVSATGTPPIHYQWLFNKEPMNTRTNELLRISPIGLSDAGDYQVLVSNSAGAVTSRVATLTVPSVEVPVKFVNSSQTLSVLAGEPATFSAVASGSGPIAYQWLFNTTNPIAGATDSSYQIPAATPQEMGLYSARAANGFSAATSAPVELRVLVRPSITEITSAPLGNVKLTFTTLSRLRYTVEYSQTLTPTNWLAVPGAVQLKGTGTGVTVGDPTSNPNYRFYRICVE